MLHCVVIAPFHHKLKQTRLKTKVKQKTKKKNWAIYNMRGLGPNQTQALKCPPGHGPCQRILCPNKEVHGCSGRQSIDHHVRAKMWL